ncbi:helix-turn-helix transcriptional regulator [Celeribacter naphthalenivorans]|uniref:helix-turn-helix transcriptional regulator n=1 Tax=Celeribacter naphthalenivorans TaxID=1614694 RepID=UPI001CFA343E|nr:AlpA family transcriptional regulator [Celeribacter naphthalenivorans]
MESRVLRRPEVEHMVGLSRSTIYAMMAEGHFPKPVRLGRRAVGWREADLRRWLASREV